MNLTLPRDGCAVNALVRPSTLASRWLTAQEAAELIGVSRVTVGKFIQRGDLPGRRVGRRYFIDRAAVERFGYLDREAGADGR